MQKRFSVLLKLSARYGKVDWKMKVKGGGSEKKRTNWNVNKFMGFDEI